MRVWLLAVIGCIALAGEAPAEVDPATVRVPQATAWVGQRVPIFYQLRAPGSFVGTAHFDLPRIPGVLLVKIGDPLVESEDIDGESWFVQNHEFALFSQKTGIIEVPEFSVTFSHREGFTGPATEIQARAPSTRIEIRRPPGSDQIGFLITTESFEISESWDPAPGAAELGAVFKRTIVQKASNLLGMSLVPAPTSAPDGIRMYPATPETHDELERGDFLGERRETFTYLMQLPGVLELPALDYVWWNPTTETLESERLAAVTFDVAAPPADATTGEMGAGRRGRWWLLASVLAGGLLLWQPRRISGVFRRCRGFVNPPDRVAARNLHRACRRDDPAGAEVAWNAWRTQQGPGFLPGPALQAALVDLRRVRYGPASTERWSGSALSEAFNRGRSDWTPVASREVSPVLPLLNSQPTTAIGENSPRFRKAER